MNSKQRVRAAISHSTPDRTPAAFEAVPTVIQKLMTHYGFTDSYQLIDHFDIDVVEIKPHYTGPDLACGIDQNGRRYETSHWGFISTYYETNNESYPMTTYYPLADIDTLDKIQNYSFPDPDWFDYEAIKSQCQQYKDKALIFGHEGPFQLMTFLMNMEDFFMLMIDNPDLAKKLLDRMVEFELEYYERTLIAADGQIDIIRPHDDYGTQVSLLFGIDLWRDFFQENTRKLANLAHQYGAFYQQHSCGAIAPLIPEFIRCGVDVLEPLQKIPGLLPEELVKWHGKIAFHGGIDTQTILPVGTPEEVNTEAEKYIKLLNFDSKGGYILMASQAIENDVPIANIEAIYKANRYI
jgi:uroporphyrinogen decarboxylase